MTFGKLSLATMVIIGVLLLVAGCLKNNDLMTLFGLVQFIIAIFMSFNLLVLIILNSDCREALTDQSWTTFVWYVLLWIFSFGGFLFVAGGIASIVMGRRSSDAPDN